MNQVVYKYPILIDRLNADSEITIELFPHARVLHVDIDPKVSAVDPVLWIQHATEGIKSPYTFRVIGTGHPAPGPAECDHVGSVVTPVGLVWHVYRRTP
jgi:hypothetical protein